MSTGTFGDYWGAGRDSIIDWNPWPPTFPRTISYPGIGSYQVTLLDSNYCGIDTAEVTIKHRSPASGIAHGHADHRLRWRVW